MEISVIFVCLIFYLLGGEIKFNSSPTFLWEAMNR